MAARFALCTKCSTRQGEAGQFEVVAPKDCFICRGLTDRTSKVGRRALRLASGYEFRTFTVGMIVPSEVQEREDQVRSELKIRGVETIKSQMAKDIASFVKVKGRKVDRRHPQLTILADLKNDVVSLSAKSVFVHGRYTKPRGVSQRKEVCETCGGRGCGECERGYSKAPSMQDVIGRKLSRIFRASDVRFTWLGSEDQDSIVYAPGRPFVAEVRNPKIRHGSRTANLVTGKGAARLSSMKVLKGKPSEVPSFVFKTKAFIEAPEGIPGDLKPAMRMKGVSIEYRNNKGKTVQKRVYSVNLSRKGSLLVSEIKLDGGLPVKRLVSGESTSPSLSEVLKTPLRCQRFDILRVWESGSFKFG